MFKLKILTALLLIISTGFSSAKNLEFKKQCGDYKYTIVVSGAETYDTAVIKHYYQKQNAKKKLFHQSEHGMFVTAACTKNKNNLDMFIFTEICGGSACIEDIYGLFDPNQKKLLLKPSDWPKGNLEEVIKILGKSDVLDSNHDYPFIEHEFCCINELADYKYKNEQLNNLNG